MNLVLGMLLLGVSSISVWGGLTDPEGGVLVGVGNLMAGRPNTKRVSDGAALFAAGVLPADPSSSTGNDPNVKPKAGGGATGGAGGGGGGGGSWGGPKVSSGGYSKPKSAGSTGSGSGSWGLRPRAAAATHTLANMFHISAGNVGGFANRNIAGTSTKSDHAFGLAADFMGAHQNLADYAVHHAGALHVKYVIFNHRIWSPARGWHAYTGVNPHTDHVHVSYLA